jgi:hypothetical protein
MAQGLWGRMKKMIRTIYKQLISKDTWERVWYFMSFNPKKKSRALTKDDILPIIIILIIVILTILIAKKLI